MHRYLLIMFYSFSIISFNYQSEIFASHLNAKRIIGQSRDVLKKEKFPSLVIDKISFKENIFPIGDKRNHIDRNIELLYADKERNNYIIVGHSGSGSTAYFKNLNKLVNGDIVSIRAKAILNYQVINKYLMPKALKNTISFREKTGNLQLITCDRLEKDKFLVIELSLQK